MKRPNRYFNALLVAAGLLAMSLPSFAHARAMGVEIWTDRGEDASGHERREPPLPVLELLVVGGAGEDEEEPGPEELEGTPAESQERGVARTRRPRKEIRPLNFFPTSS